MWSNEVSLYTTFHMFAIQCFFWLIEFNLVISLIFEIAQKCQEKNSAMCVYDITKVRLCSRPWNCKLFLILIDAFFAAFRI